MWQRRASSGSWRACSTFWSTADCWCRCSSRVPGDVRCRTCMASTGERGPAASEPEPGREALPELPPHHHPGRAARPLPRVALRRRSGMGPGRRRQLRPPASRRRLLDAATRGAHGHGPPDGARAAGESLQGNVGCGQLPGVHADPGTRHRHRSARLRAHAQRAAASRQLLAAGGARGTPSSHGGGRHLLPSRIARPRLLHRSDQAALRPDRPTRLQPAQRGDGRQARPCDGDRLLAPWRTRPGSAGGGTGRDAGRARPLPAAPSGAVPVR